MINKKRIKIGYTTGVFDLFHIGHLNLIRKAKKKCDFLIVGVSNDKLCIKVKKKKPVIPFNERFLIIKSLKYVDRAVEEKADDKIKAHNKYKFNIIFKGDDHKKSKKWKEWKKEFKKRKTKIIFFKYTKGTSSTLIKNVCEKINRR